MVETFTPAVCGSRTRQRLAIVLFAGGAVLAVVVLAVAVIVLELGAAALILVPAAHAKKLAALLAKVDAAAIETKVRKTELDELDDEDVDDADSLADEDDPPAVVGNQVRALATFYRLAAEKGLGVVMVTE